MCVCVGRRGGGELNLHSSLLMQVLRDEFAEIGITFFRYVGRYAGSALFREEPLMRNEQKTIPL